MVQIKTSYAIVDGQYKNAFGQSFDTLEQLEQATNEIEARREKLAGRALSKRELVNGIDKPMSIRERIERENWKIQTGDAPAVDDNPFRADLQKIEEERKVGGMTTREKLTRKAADEWDAKREAEAKAAARQAEFAADPRRQKALALAASQLEWAQFSQEGTAGDVAQAERTLAQLQNGLLGPGLTMLEKGRARIDTISKERSAQLQEAMDHVRQTYQTQSVDAIETAPTYVRGAKYLAAVLHPDMDPAELEVNNNTWLDNAVKQGAAQ